MPNLTYSDGRYTIDSTKLPDAVLTRMLQTATNHILGNEVASAVGGWIKSQVVNGSDRKAADVTQAELEAFRDAQADAVAAKTHELREAKIAAMLDGTLSIRTVGTGTVHDPVEAACRAIAKLEITAVLKNAGGKFPTKDGTIKLGNAELTGDDLIERRMTHAEHGPRIRKEAERKVAADKRMREQAARAASGVTSESLNADLGL